MIKIAIDPDIKKSGIAIFRDKVLIDAFPAKMEKILEVVRTYASSPDTVVYIEAGWLNKKSNFRVYGRNKAISENVAKKVGQNMGYGMAIRDLVSSFCKTVEVKPIMKGVYKTNGKWTPNGRRLFDACFQDIKLNDDVRDAILIGSIF